MKIFYYSLVLLCSIALWGCSSGNGGSGVDPTTGKHVTGWAANGGGGLHPDAYFSDPKGCASCHGEKLDGGISGVSCSNPGRSGVNCHPSFPHAAGFAAPAMHGSVARDVAAGLTGMAHCQKCHGGNYTGDVGPSCIACHKLTNPTSEAPHAYNWVSGNSSGLRHSQVNLSNAPACAQCHLGGRYSHPAPTPAPPNTVPGCFNGTLCHNNAGHALPYVTGHQADASSNLASCQACHGNPTTGANPRFNVSKGTGVLNVNGCENCHNRPGIAHPYMWLPGRGVVGQNSASHANAGTVNSSCGLCHGGTALSGGSGPSCFQVPAINGTTCHFTKPVDASGTTVGCASCHGDQTTGRPNGTAAPNRAFRHTPHFANIVPTTGAPAFTCSACHLNLGSPLATHATKLTFAAMTAAVAPDTSNFSETGTAAYNPVTQQCASVSCHGGKTITNTWKSATAFSMTNCINCHTIQVAPGALPTGYTGAYVGPASGYVDPITGFNNLHTYHIIFQIGGGSTSCVTCHANPVPGHFANVTRGKRNIIATTPSATNIAAGSISGSAISSYNPVTSSCLTNGSAIGLSCHDSGPKLWFGP